MSVVVTWADIRGLKRFNKGIDALNKQFPKVVPRIMNQVGDRSKTRVVRALTKQTGLQRDVVKRAVDSSRAYPGKLIYDLRTKGGNIRLKYLKPRETPAGVVAYPFGKKTLYPGTFMSGGIFPDRKEVEKWKGHVKYRVDRKGRMLGYARSGVFIPVEMIQGASEAAFQAEVNTTLPKRIDQVLRKLSGG